MGYLFVTICLMVYGQLVLKWRISLMAMPLPEGLVDKLFVLARMLFDPWVFSGFCAAFFASLFWMAAISKLQLSYAYPFMSLAFVLVLVLSGLLLQEAITWPKIIGTALIVLGVIVASQR